MSLSKAYFDLVEQQGQIVKKQSETIGKLVNVNAEQENLIDELMREHVGE
jgi:hypothetical protein